MVCPYIGTDHFVLLTIIETRHSRQYLKLYSNRFLPHLDDYIRFLVIKTLQLTETTVHGRNIAQLLTHIDYEPLYLFLLINAACLAKEQQLPKLLSLDSPDWFFNPRSTTLEESMLTKLHHQCGSEAVVFVNVHGSWIYNYLCSQCLSPLTLRVGTPLTRGVIDTTLCDIVCHWLAAGWWSSPGTSVSSINKNWPPRYNWNIVESDVKHHNPNPNPM